MERLKEEYTVIAVDIRGSGKSDFLTDVSDYKIEKICADLDAVADACDIQDFAVWGFSFGGNIARYLGAWSNRVKAIAVIGVPFGPAVDDVFDQFIDEFIDKYGPLAQEYNEGKISGTKRKSAIKGGIPVWTACFQAMRHWPKVDPGDISCPMLLSGTENKNVMDWIKSNQEDLDRARCRVEIIEGLTHQQEFSQMEQIYPAVSSFLREWVESQFKVVLGKVFSSVSNILVVISVQHG